MKYVKMSIEEANKLIKKNVTVLVSVQDLESLENDEIVEFQKKNEFECTKIINEAETVARVYDDFMNQLRVFTSMQLDVIDYEQRGKLSTILLKE